ncbi:hypothetical protein PM8797T_21233 [Gimesia maris DSM 8797]|nr:hypothetical protein PM8797T_21233 [Gimesia maris DSM 8797]
MNWENLLPGTGSRGVCCNGCLAPIQRSSGMIESRGSL